MKYYIIIFLLISILLLLKHNYKKYEKFEAYDFSKHLTENNQSELVGRIIKLRKNNLYRKNIIPKTLEIDILKQDLNFFIDNDLKKINRKIILNIIDHPINSTDKSVYNYKNFLENKNIIKVKSEDWRDKPHNKLKILPIGFESIAKLNNDEKKMIDISKKQKKIEDKPLKVMCNAHFSKYKKPASDSYNQRMELYEKLKNNNIIHFWEEKTDRIKTWELHDNYSFELCPEGNGMDTHRFYEALFLNTIPIVKKNTLEPMYKQFPCVIVNDWEEITETNCKIWKKKLSKRVENDKFKLQLKYWLN